MYADARSRTILSAFCYLRREKAAPLEFGERLSLASSKKKGLATLPNLDPYSPPV